MCDWRCFLKCFPVCPPVETLLRKHVWLAMFPQSFPVCPPAETLLRKQNLLPGKQKCFLWNSETFHVSQAWFLLWKHCFLVFSHLGKHGETLAGNNFSATMFPQQCFLVCPRLNTLVWYCRKIKVSQIFGRFYGCTITGACILSWFDNFWLLFNFYLLLCKVCALIIKRNFLSWFLTLPPSQL